MSQATVNEKWKQKFQSNVGEIVMLVPPKRQSGLRKPYDFVAPMAEVAALVKDVKTILQPYANGRLQCGHVATKSASRGRKFSVFLLGYKPGFCGTPDGISAADWESVASTVKSRIANTLGDCEMYIEDWNPDHKFQARFETYIMYQEMHGL